MRRFIVITSQVTNRTALIQSTNHQRGVILPHCVVYYVCFHESMISQMQTNQRKKRSRDTVNCELCISQLLNGLKETGRICAIHQDHEWNIGYLPLGPPSSSSSSGPPLSPAPPPLRSPNHRFHEAHLQSGR